jgi:predicted GIY-YIG superfamily endonuclease
MASQRNGTLYTGVTANLSLRAFEHREGLINQCVWLQKARLVRVL